MKTLNISIPEDLSRDLEVISDKGRFIAEALKEKMERERKKGLDHLLIEGYKLSKKEDKALNEEWEKITLEGWI